MTTAVRVEITRELHTSLARQGIDSGVFISAFKEWKTNWPKHEYNSALFGKDGSYIAPKVDGMSYQLRHVHLVPLIDEAALSNWKKVFRRFGRKTSDRVLVYAGDNRGVYLLIYILDEPAAHEIADMRTPTHKAIMHGFAEVAAAFLEDGSIIR